MIKHAHCKFCVLCIHDKCVVFTLTVAHVEMVIVHERNIKKLGKQKTTTANLTRANLAIPCHQPEQDDDDHHSCSGCCVPLLQRMTHEAFIRATSLRWTPLRAWRPETKTWPQSNRLDSVSRLQSIQHRNVRLSPCSHIWHVLVVSQHFSGLLLQNHRFSACFF